MYAIIESIFQCFAVFCPAGILLFKFLSNVMLLFQIIVVVLLPHIKVETINSISGKPGL